MRSREAIQVALNAQRQAMAAYVRDGGSQFGPGYRDHAAKLTSLLDELGNAYQQTAPPTPVVDVGEIAKLELLADQARQAALRLPQHDPAGLNLFRAAGTYRQQARELANPRPATTEWSRLRTAVGRLENITPADSALLDVLEAHGLTPGHAEAVLIGRRHDKPSTPLDVSTFWSPTVEKIVSALPSADAEAARAGREPAAFYDALSQVVAPS
jgi:hypothetical protein